MELMQPRGSKRLNIDLDETLWNKLDIAAEVSGDKKRIVEQALSKALEHIQDPGPNYKPKNQIRHKKKNKSRILPAFKDFYQKCSLQE